MARTRRRAYVRNPYTGRMILRDGQTARDVFDYHKSSLDIEGESYKYGYGRYRNLGHSDFCGPEGGAPMGTYPVNTESRCRAALTYAKYAPDPRGIEECAVRKARRHGWRCGTSSSELWRNHIKPSRGRWRKSRRRNTR